MKLSDPAKLCRIRYLATRLEISDTYIVFALFPVHTLSCGSFRQLMPRIQHPHELPHCSETAIDDMYLRGDQRPERILEIIKMRAAQHSSPYLSSAYPENLS